MSQDPYDETSSPLVALVGGTIFLAIAGVFFVNMNESPETFAVLTMLAAGPGLFMVIAGAVAQGIHLSRS